MLVLAGLWAHRVGLIVWGVVFVVAGVAVVASWRYHRRRFEELERAHQALRQELLRIGEQAREARH